MTIKYGLQARFLAVAVAAFLLMVGLTLLMIQRQHALQREVAELGQGSMHGLLFDRMRARGEAMATDTADALVNPLYYFDTETIGAVARNVLRQPDVSYVLVFDPNGSVIHDGSGDIAVFGQAMRDGFAGEAIKAAAVHSQQNDEVLDIAAPILLGNEKLGGLRIGYSLTALKADETAAVTELNRRMDELGRRNVSWALFMLLLLAALVVGLAVLVQRGLVRPIRQLAAAARQIESGNFDVSIAPTRRQDEVGSLVRAFARMGEGIGRHDREIRHIAYTDSLTGLSNRLAFREHLDQRLIDMGSVGRQLALLFADIDDFKHINDSLGHDVGDHVLVAFSRRINAVIDRFPAADALLSRFGGDEFVMLLESRPEYGEDVQQLATQIGEALVQELRQPLEVEGHSLFLGSSIGITVFPQDASSAAMLIKNGDVAMYQAKLAGKHCYRFYSKAMDQAAVKRVKLEQEFRGAWERGELSVLYQPIYRVSDRALVGAEALLRWQHPVEGAIAPSVFIELAEHNGQIEQLGIEVLRTACQDAARWQSASDREPLFVSVNLSARQLHSEALPGLVEQMLQASGLDPHRLHLELTETAVLGDEHQAVGMLNRLRAAGVRIWLDDFGTGFSGLSHLRRVPVDGVKIDRTFVADILRDPDDLALTTAIITMAHSLGIIVVAEGVEKEGQYDILRQRGCDLAQGFWLGLPMDGVEFDRLLFSDDAEQDPQDRDTEADTGIA